MCWDLAAGTVLNYLVQRSVPLTHPALTGSGVLVEEPSGPVREKLGSVYVGAWYPWPATAEAVERFGQRWVSGGKLPIVCPEREGEEYLVGVLRRDEWADADVGEPERLLWSVRLLMFAVSADDGLWPVRFRVTASDCEVFCAASRFRERVRRVEVEVTRWFKRSALGERIGAGGRPLVCETREEFLQWCQAAAERLGRDNEPFTQERLAYRLGIDVSTLKRYLQRYGLSWSDLRRVRLADRLT